MNTLPAVIWSLLIGSWTDKYIHGRKILLCLSSISGIITSLLHILNAIFFKWSNSYNFCLDNCFQSIIFMHLLYFKDPYYLLLNSIPNSLTGGFMATLMAVYSYVSVNTPENSRSIRYAFVEFSFFLGTNLLIV